MPSTKAKPIPTSLPKHNRRDRTDSPDKKSKKGEPSPSKTSVKKGKNADHNKERRVKLLPPIVSLNDKSRVNSHTKQEKDKQAKKDPHPTKIPRLDLNKSIKLIKPDGNKLKDQEKQRNPKVLTSLVKFSDDKKIKRPHSSCSQKLLKRPHNDLKFNPKRSMSQKGICVNTVKHWYAPLESDGNSESSDDKEDSDPKRSALKRMLRRQLWSVSKGVIKRNEDWSKLMAENRIDVDKINIDALDLSLIDIDALGIENKLLKRTITWFLK